MFPKILTLLPTIDEEESVIHVMALVPGGSSTTVNETEELVVPANWSLPDQEAATAHVPAFSGV